MDRLRELWKHSITWISTPGRLVEYSLIAVYASVAILTVFAGFTNQAGKFYGHAVETVAGAARPELGSMFKVLMKASADFSVGASLLVVGAFIVYRSRREKLLREHPDQAAPSGPPFLL